MTSSGDEFLLEWNAIGSIRKAFEYSKASLQSGLTVEPLMINNA